MQQIQTKVRHKIQNYSPKFGIIDANEGVKSALDSYANLYY
jgi:hypothetical protein